MSLSILDDVLSRRYIHHPLGIRILNVDTLSFEAPAQIRILLSSPPYLNRLDYVVQHLAPLGLLQPLTGVLAPDLRKRMLGTNLIVSKEEPDPLWGPLCLQILERIRHHRSKDSASYYLWTFTRYFRQLFAFAGLARTWCPEGARGAIVIQNSFYKELVVPVAEILVQMAERQGIEARIARREPVRKHMGTISPHQKTYVPAKVLEEAIVTLNF